MVKILIPRKRRKHISDAGGILNFFHDNNRDFSRIFDIVFFFYLRFGDLHAIVSGGEIDNLVAASFVSAVSSLFYYKASVSFACV